jgi:hypothetical protein
MLKDLKKYAGRAEPEIDVRKSIPSAYIVNQDGREIGLRQTATTPRFCTVSIF